jgi:hypothetical protein
VVILFLGLCACQPVALDREPDQESQSPVFEVISIGDATHMCMCSERVRPSGVGGTTCAAQAPMDSPACTSCMLEECCAAMLECDYGTECQEWAECYDAECSGQTAEECAHGPCLSHENVSRIAIEAWELRSDCARDFCAADCEAGI